MPKIEIPAMQQENLTSLTADDFRVSYSEEEYKGTVDPRLKNLEKQENAPKPVLLKKPSIIEGGRAISKLKTEIDLTSNNVEEVSKTTPPIPALKSVKPPILIIPKKQRMIVDQEPVEEHIEMPTPTVCKVLIGVWKDPKKAKAAIEEIALIDEELIPFIRKRNKKYYLQLASYDTEYEALEMAEKFEELGYYTKIINE